MNRFMGLGASTLEVRTRPLESSPSRLEAIIAVQHELMAAELDLAATLNLIASRAQRLTCADGAIVQMEEGEDLVYWVALGIADGQQGTRISAANSLAGMSHRTNQVLLCEDTENDPRVDLGACRRLGVRSMVVVPVRHGGRSAGVLKVVAGEPHAFGREHADTLRLMAGMIGAAVVRATDYDAKRKLIAERDAAIAEGELALRSREAAVQSLEESTAVLRSFFSAAPFLMAIVQMEGKDFRFLAVNDRLAQMLGTTPEQALGRSASELHSDFENLATAVKACREAEAANKPVFWDYARGEGDDKRHLAAVVSPLPGGQARYCVVIQDVTERTLLRARVELNDRMASVGRLAAGVAHEANNPLAYVASNLRFLQDMLSDPACVPEESLREEMLRAVSESREGAERIKLIIKDLYTFVRAEDEPMEPLDLSAIAKRAAGMCSHILQPRSLVTLDLHPAPAHGGSARLGQVIINILVNAAQAMPPDRAREANHVWLSSGVLPDGRPFVTVRDNGIGMTPEVRARIFDPFFTTKALGTGMGLGLTLCHNIVQAHGGDLCVESTPNAGTTLRLTLPAASTPANR